MDVLYRGKLAQLSQLQTQRGYNRAHITLLIVDALTIIEGDFGLLKRELVLAKDIVKEGKSIIVLLNKVDNLAAGKRREVSTICNFTVVSRSNTDCLHDKCQTPSSRNSATTPPI